MKILFVATEAIPFAKTGGLADVVGSLPQELKKLGVEVGIILPKYSKIIPEAFKNTMVTKKTLQVSVGWRKKYCGVQQIDYQGISYYFIENDDYFDREGLYGFGDDGERYAFFCRAVLEALPYLDFKPDILHCHDWHTGPISLLLKDSYKNDPFYQNMATIFTIHNLKYQGIFPKEILLDLFGLDENKYFCMDAVEFYEQVNFMKAGIVFSDLITTVSNTYAKEIKTPFYGEQLDGILSQREGNIKGIINGIDYDEYNPIKDSLIVAPYDSKSLTKKLLNKKHLQKALGLPQTNKIPMIAMVSRLVEQKGLCLIKRVLDEILALDVQLVILGTGEKEYENWLQEAAKVYPNQLSVSLTYDEKLAHRIYAGADLFLMPSMFEPCGLAQLIALRYGTLPIVRETGGLKDTVKPFNEDTGEGYGFSFTNYNAHDMLVTIERAIGYFRQKPTWTKIRKQAMTKDYSWNNSAKEYYKIYRQVLTDSSKDKELNLLEKVGGEVELAFA